LSEFLAIKLPCMVPNIDVSLCVFLSFNQQDKILLLKSSWGWGFSSVVECLPRKRKALGSVPSSEKKNQKKKKKEKKGKKKKERKKRRKRKKSCRFLLSTAKAKAKDPEFKASLGYIKSSRLIWVTE